MQTDKDNVFKTPRRHRSVKGSKIVAADSTPTSEAAVRRVQSLRRTPSRLKSIMNKENLADDLDKSLEIISCYIPKYLKIDTNTVNLTEQVESKKENIEIHISELDSNPFRKTGRVESKKSSENLILPSNENRLAKPLRRNPTRSNINCAITNSDQETPSVKNTSKRISVSAENKHQPFTIDNSELDLHLSSKTERVESKKSSESLTLPSNETQSVNTLKRYPTKSKLSMMTNTDHQMDSVEKSLEALSLTKDINPLAEYFRNQRCKASVHSKNTMSSFGSHRLNAEMAKELLKRLPNPICIKEIENRLMNIYSNTFPRIFAQLTVGYNVVLYGFGSKINLLQAFRTRYLANENCVTIPGYLSDLDLQQCLLKIITEYLGSVYLTSKSPLALCEVLKNHFSRRTSEKLFLVISNIDGPVLRNNFDCFNLLTQSSAIQIVASVDHIRSDTLFCNANNWLWHDCTTFQPYIAETNSDHSKLFSKCENSGLESLRHVMASLPTNAKLIFQQLAKHQIEHSSNSYEGMSMDILYTRCREKFLVANQMSLRMQLGEFKDHRIIVVRTGFDRSEYVKVLLDVATIREFLDNFDEF